MAKNLTTADSPAQGADVTGVKSVKDRIKKHEGKGKPGRDWYAYSDDVVENGKLTQKATSVGYGYNMTASPKQARAEFKEVGADYDKVLKQEVPLTEAQANALFEKSYARAEKGAKNIFPDLDTHPEVVQESIVEMVYQMGEGRDKTAKKKGTGVRGFTKMRKAIEDRDYEKAAKEALDSGWATQTANRAKTVAGQIKSAKDAPVPEATPAASPLELAGPPSREDLQREDQQIEADFMAGRKPPESKAEKIRSLIMGTEDKQADPRDIQLEDIATKKRREADADEVTVAKGDTLSKLAAKYDTTVEELAKLNDIKDVNKIKAGQTLKLPDMPEFKAAPSMKPLSESLAERRSDPMDPEVQMGPPEYDAYLGKEFMSRQRKRNNTDDLEKLLEGVDTKDWRTWQPQNVIGPN